MPRPIPTTAALMLILSAGLQACSHATVDSRRMIADGLQSEMHDIRLSIDREIGEARAQRPEQCRVHPVGAKACGGPQAYLVYSTATSSERQIEELARRYTEAEQKYNRVTGSASTCSYLMPPAVGLENGKCVSEPRRGR